MSEPVFQRPSLTDIAYEEIKKSVCLGKFKPGHKLVVDELVKAYDISNTPIKEALNRLVADGLVEAVPRKGMHVKKFERKDIEEAHELRLMYETFCAAKAVKVIDDRPDVKAKLWSKITAMEQLLKNSSSYMYKTYNKQDHEFHFMIVLLAGNDILVREYLKLKAIDMAFNNYIDRDAPSERCNDALIEHKLIYEALVEKDIFKLLEYVEQHITNVKYDLLDLLTKKILFVSKN